jgi:methionyl-tRNA formyltransferase
VYYSLFLAAADRRQEAAILTKLCEYPALPDSTPELIADNPNRDEVRQFLLDRAPDIILARCKFLLKEETYSLARIGTFVMHPGICPEYRNAHGCFWALARNDLANVGLTLLKIDRGVDTGPVYGYYRYAFDEVGESHIVIQHRCGFENLDSIAEKIREIERGTAIPIDTAGRKSSTWGQPWLSAYLRWKRAARKRRSRA